MSVVRCFVDAPSAIAPSTQPLKGPPTTDSQHPIPLQGHGQSIPLTRLAALEPVSQQFLDYGLTIQGAIALVPSNPYFVDHKPHISLMASGHAPLVRLTLHRAFQAMTLKLRGYHDFHLDSFDHQGYRLGSTIIQRSRYSIQDKAPVETIVLAAPGVHTIVLSSMAVFLIDSIELLDADGPV
jgi:hypothetical protein